MTRTLAPGGDILVQPRCAGVRCVAGQPRQTAWVEKVLGATPLDRARWGGGARLQFVLQFNTVWHRPGTTDRRRWPSLNRSGRPRSELLMRLGTGTWTKRLPPTEARQLGATRMNDSPVRRTATNSRQRRRRGHRLL
jgi:hypothetical protein